MLLDFLNETFITKRTLDELLLNSIDDYDNCIWIKDIKGDYKFVNRKLCEALGEDKETMLSSNSRDIFDENSYKVIGEDDEEVIKNKKSSIINEHIYINGKEFILHTHKLPIINDDGSCTSFFAVARKIDNIELDNESYLGSDNFTASIVNNENKRHFNDYKDIYEVMEELYQYPRIEGVSVWVLTKDLTFNKLRGIGIVEDILNDYEIRISEVENEELLNSYSDFSKQVSMKEYEEFYRKNNLDYIFDNYLKEKKKIRIPIVNNSKLLGILNIYSNIPNYDKTSENYFKKIGNRIALRIENIKLSNELLLQFSQKVKSENELNLFLRIATDLCFILDEEGKIRKVSSNAVNLLGWSKEEIKGMHIREIFDFNEKSIDLRKLESIYNQKCYGGIYKLRCKDGSFKLMEWYYCNERATKQIYLMGKEVNIVVELQAKVKELEEKINRESFKNDFLSNISHEFKTPLNIILSSIQLMMLNEETEEKNHRILNTIKQNSYRLLRLINNLIDITKFENNKVVLHKENINIISFIEEIVGSLAGYVKNMKRSITFDTDEEEVFLACDLDSIERIVLNLISNGIKYTEENGNILVEIKTDWNKRRLYVSVKDDGIGIAEENIDLAFERFKRLDNTYTRRAEGSGIGLSLIKSILDLHKGKIDVYSQVGRGSEFVFYLPIETVDVEEKNPVTENIFQSKVERYNIELSDIYAP